MHLPTHEYRKLLSNNNLISTFESLKLIKPFWYFHFPSGTHSLRSVPVVGASSIELDIEYDSRKSAILEANFIMLMKGWKSKRDITNNERLYKRIIQI